MLESNSYADPELQALKQLEVAWKSNYCRYVSD